MGDGIHCRMHQQHNGYQNWACHMQAMQQHKTGVFLIKLIIQSTYALW